MATKKLNQTEIIDLLKNEQLTLADVIDAVIKINGIIGVGKISLIDDITAYIKSQE